MPSTANVAMPADSPESRIRGAPTTSAYAPPSAVASSSDQAFETVWSRMNGNRDGRTPGLTSAGTVISPAAKAPTATKLTCPNESTPELPTKT